MGDQDRIVTVELAGGLGNQLFQIATAYAFGAKYNRRLVLPKIESSPSIFKNRPVYWDSIFSKFQLSDPDLQHTFTIVKEESMGYNTLSDCSGQAVRLSGYFQTAKYFGHVRESFIEKLYLVEDDQLLTFFAKDETYVSVHVRRGDYLQLQYFNVVQPKEYYTRAMSMFPDCTFVVFSDDIEWCRENISDAKIGNIIYCTDKFGINVKMPQDVFELRLMSLCHHNIISNSTFSWWGAWLNRNPTKQVVAPGNWFVEQRLNDQIKDIYESNWCVIRD